MIWIILPVRNECATIENTMIRLNQMIGEGSRYRAIFIDDYSTDDTFHKINNLRVLYSNMSVVKNKGPQGKGSAIRYGFNFISSTEKEIMMQEEIVFLDGDGQINPIDIHTGILTMTRYCCNVAIGNKRHRYSHCKYSLIRNTVSLGYNWLIRTMFNINIPDTQCGIKIFRYHALKEAMSKVTTNGFAFDLELIMSLKGFDSRIVDFCVHIDKQLNNGSVNFKNIIQTFLDTCCIFIRYKKNYYKLLPRKKSEK